MSKTKAFMKMFRPTKEELAIALNHVRINALLARDYYDDNEISCIEYGGEVLSVGMDCDHSLFTLTDVWDGDYVVQCLYCKAYLYSDLWPNNRNRQYVEIWFSKKHRGAGGWL